MLSLENVGGEYPWKLVIGVNGMNSQIGGQMDAGIVVNDWTDTDAGNCYQIVEAIKVSTGIESIVTDHTDANVIYDLQGRKVVTPGRGIYIVNGKKVIF